MASDRSDLHLPFGGALPEGDAWSQARLDPSLAPAGIPVYTPPSLLEVDMKHTNPKDIIGSGKVPLELFPQTAIIAGCMAFHEGAAKYGRFNWRLAGVRSSIYAAALQRHMTAWWNGEDIDADSGLPHLWKALACLAILIDADECDMLTDDRAPYAPVGKMLERCLPMVGEILERHKDKAPKQYTLADKPPTPPKKASTTEPGGDDLRICPLCGYPMVSGWAVGRPNVTYACTDCSYEIILDLR